ncbi:MAG: hypothetical protein M3Z25_20085 [Actinomycetota bacterium]|nr:hypothetical protein [Actinomycetota bacterium]
MGRSDESKLPKLIKCPSGCNNGSVKVKRQATIDGNWTEAWDDAECPGCDGSGQVESPGQ